MQVRDRATLYLQVLGDDKDIAPEGAAAFLSETLTVPLANLEASLKAYVSLFLSLVGHACRSVPRW